jgi:hypothetical protein
MKQCSHRRAASPCYSSLPCRHAAVGLNGLAQANTSSAESSAAQTRLRYARDELDSAKPSSRPRRNA